MCSSDLWFTGAEAKHFGLVDTVTDKVAINNKFDLSKYNFKNISEAASGLQVSQESIETATAHDATSSISAACAAEKPTAAVESGGINNQKKDQPMENIQAAAVTSTANSDNSAVLARIDALEAKLIKPGAEPISATSNIEVADSDAVRQFKNLRHGSEKRDFIVSNYARLTAELPKHGIYNANTIDSGLANSLLASDAVQTMRTYVAPLGAFTKAVSVSPISPRQVINVPLVSSSGSIQTNPTNFETGDTTAGDIAVTVNQYSKSWAVSHAEGNLGLKLAQLAPTNAAVLSEGLVALVTAKMTNANYGADNVIGAAANFDSADLPAVLALGKNFSRVTLLLDGGHLAYLLPTTRESFVFGEAGAYGFDGGIYKNNLWTGGATDIAGFVCGPDAIAIATGQPANLPNGEYVTQEVVSIGAGISVTATTWFSRASRAMWGSFDVMFGCAVGDATQGKVLTTA